MRGSDPHVSRIIGSPELQSTLDLPMSIWRALLRRQVRAKALGDDHALHSAIDFILQNFDGCMVNSKTPDDSKSGSEDGRLEDEDDPMAVSVPACLEDDESPAVDLLLALAKRCSPPARAHAGALLLWIKTHQQTFTFCTFDLKVSTFTAHIFAWLPNHRVASCMYDVRKRRGHSLWYGMLCAHFPPLLSCVARKL